MKEKAGAFLSLIYKILLNNDLLIYDVTNFLFHHQVKIKKITFLEILAMELVQLFRCY